MEKSRTYDVLELWLKNLMIANPFIEENFWEKHYSVIKNKYINEKDIFVYKEDDVIKGFICVAEDNFIAGLFVDPEYQGNGIGKKLLSFVKTEYSLLHVNVYAKNKAALSFASREGFVIDGATLNPEDEEIQYEMYWRE